MNTRFNPSLCGYLHLGHAVMALINECVAHSQGGKFLVRFDDNQFWWNQKYNQAETDRFSDAFQEDLEWLEICADGYSWQSKREDEYDTMLMKLNRGPLPMQCSLVSRLEGPKCHYTTATPYPFAPDLTANHVILDFLDEINPLIRGEDLVDESGAYDMLCRMWRIPRPEQHYMARLKVMTEGGLQEISKTNGNLTVRELRKQGWSAKSVRDMLADACLIDREGKWNIDNIKFNPHLTL